MFNISLADLVFIRNSMDIANYADDNQPHATTPNDINSLIESLEEAPNSLLTWFNNNLMKGNADKCHLLFSLNEKITVKIGSHQIVNSKREKLLGVYLDSGLSYDYRISDICKKESREANEF